MPPKIHVVVSPSLPAKVQKNLHEYKASMQIFLFLIQTFSNSLIFFFFFIKTSSFDMLI